MSFRGPQPASQAPATPEALFADLPRSPGAVSGLWVHQGDVLRQYVANHLQTQDLAIELPTGTGKTLPGLLIADWCRRARVQRVAYACPTRQLARQVFAAARREGIPAVLLIGSHVAWDTPAVSAYEGAAAVAVVTYSTIFNSNPHLYGPGTLMFDDAHAGEQYVAEAFAVSVRRFEEPAIYLKVLESLSPALDGMFVQRLREPDPDHISRRDVRLVVPLLNSSLTEKLDSALGPLSGDQYFRFAMIRAQLRSCLVYVSWSAVYIRPFIPPTFENTPFSSAQQRIYLSATLGEGGELERAFGRSAIARLALPESAGQPRAGRRFFIFPELAGGTDGLELTRRIVESAGKALVLTRSSAVRSPRGTFCRHRCASV